MTIVGFVADIRSEKIPQQLIVFFRFIEVRKMSLIMKGKKPGGRVKLLQFFP